jgi:hypothetical protein
LTHLVAGRKVVFPYAGIITGKEEALATRIASLAIVALCAFALTACVGISPETKMKISQPVNCSSGSADISYLESEHASGGKRLLQGLFGIMPPSIIISLFRAAAKNPEGMYLDHWKVASGSYNEQMVDRVASIKEQCNL